MTIAAYWRADAAFQQLVRIAAAGNEPESRPTDEGEDQRARDEMAIRLESVAIIMADLLRVGVVKAEDRRRSLVLLSPYAGRAWAELIIPSGVQARAASQ